MKVTASWLEIDPNPDLRTLRQFGFLALPGFGAMAACAWYESSIFGVSLGAARAPVTALLAVLACGSCALSLLYPRANRWLFVLTARAAHPIGLLMSFAMLAALFFFVVAPIGAVMRLLGRDALRRRCDPNAPSYWSDARRRRSPTSYFRQF